MATTKRKTAVRKVAARPTVSEVPGDDVGAAEMNQRVASALRRLRKQRNLSLDALSVKSGVSRAALSQIESARSNPTLSVLWKIAIGLEIAFHELLVTPNEEPLKVLRAGDVNPRRSADRRVESRLVAPGGTAAAADTYELRFAPKGVQRSEPHRKGTVETVVVLKGSLRITVGDFAVDLGVGDSAFLRADLPHSYENRSSHETRIVNIIS